MASKIFTVEYIKSHFSDRFFLYFVSVATIYKLVKYDIAVRNFTKTNKNQFPSNSRHNLGMTSTARQIYICCIYAAVIDQIIRRKQITLIIILCKSIYVQWLQKREFKVTLINA